MRRESAHCRWSIFAHFVFITMLQQITFSDCAAVWIGSGKPVHNIGAFWHIFLQKKKQRPDFIGLCFLFKYFDKESYLFEGGISGACRRTFRNWTANRQAVKVTAMISAVGSAR